MTLGAAIAYVLIGYPVFCLVATAAAYAAVACVAVILWIVSAVVACVAWGINRVKGDKRA